MTTKEATRGMFAPTGLALNWVGPRGRKVGVVHLCSPEPIAWDGAAPETNAALYLDHRDVFVYVELRITGRSEMRHTGGIWGTKARVRFTGPDDTGEWLDAIVQRVYN